MKGHLVHIICTQLDLMRIIALLSQGGGLSAFAGAGLAHNIINTQHLGNMNAFGGSINAGVAYALSFLEFEFRIRYLIYDIPEKYSTQGFPPMVAGQQVKYQMVDLNSPFSFHLGGEF